MTTEEIKKHITAYCGTRSEIVACYLYGSRAAGKERPDSDVDVAFLLDGSVTKERYSDLRVAFYGDLAKLVRLDLHILIMNNAGELVLGEVLREGIPLYIRDEEVVERFRMRKIPLIAEFTYYSELFRRKLVERYGGMA